MTTKIVPLTQTQTQSVTIASFTVTCRAVNLYKDASFMVDTFDNASKLISRQVLTMTTEQYLLWNSDDSYVNKFVAESLGFTII